MSFQSPFDQPTYKAKAKKKVSKAKRKKVAQKVAQKRATRKPVTGSARTGCPTRKKKVASSAEIIRVSKAELEKLRKNVARPTWTDMLPESKRKTFVHKGRRYWPIYSLLYMISAIEAERGFKPHKLKHGELLGVRRVQFVQRGSLIDV